MDFLDPKTEQRSQTRLFLGYCLMALAIGIATLVLLYQAYGFGIDRQGTVTQSGLLFVASQPSDSAIYLNGVRYKDNSDTRVTVPAGRYDLRISQTGYRPWDRPVFVAGGDVQRFVYPLLIPETLKTTSLQDLTADPTFATQSPDKRWILLGQPTAGVITQYDLKDPKKPVASTLALPAASFTPGDGVQSWTALEWAANSRNVLMQHTYTTGGTGNREFLLVDRDTPGLSVNLTDTLNLEPGETVELFNNRTGQFHVYNVATQTLRRVNGSDAVTVSSLGHVLAYKPYSDNKILYVTDESPTGKAVPGMVSVVLQDGQQTYGLRTLPAAGAGSFVLNLAEYANDWYVAVGSAGDTAVYVYKNPQSQTAASPDTYPEPWRRLALGSPTYLEFSSTGQFLLAESGQNFVVYDLENIAHYRYQATNPIDAPQLHASWMDGYRLTYVSGGVTRVFDYDYRNVQALVSANSTYLPFFAPRYSHLYAVRSVSLDAPAALTSTPLTVPK